MKIIILTMLLMTIFSATVFAASIEITGDRATPEYWTKADGDKVLLNANQIKTLNNQMHERDSYAANMSKYPTQMPASEINAMLREASADSFKHVDAVKNPVKVQYAVTVRRTNVRLLPQPWNGDNYDDNQATALDPAEAVAILLMSRDNNFAFCQARNYFGWIDRNDLALTDRNTWQSYAAPKDFLVVIDHKKFVTVEGNQLLFQMGAVIPLIQTANDDTMQNPLRIAIPAFPSVAVNKSGSEWLARLPVSNKGRLKEVYVPITDDKSINYGWLPCTQNNFIRQAFKFLGDEYGWGGLNDSVDCSSFVGDVYRSMGIELPRDAGRQEGAMPIFAVFNNVNNFIRYDIVKRSPVGALLFKPGHVMMYLGQDKLGNPLVIHAASSYISNGEKIYIRKVIVSNLLYQGVANVETINQLTTVSAVTGGSSGQ